MADDSRDADVMWARDVRMATTWHELIAVLDVHGMEVLRDGLNQQRTEAEQAGVHMARFEHEKLQEMRAWVLRHFLDQPEPVDGGGPIGVREPAGSGPIRPRPLGATAEPPSDASFADALGTPRRE
jgi:hypothetical protein